MHGRLLIILVGLAVGPVQGLEAKKGEWLLRQDPAAYTLQVITVSSAVQVAKLLDQHDHQRFASFRIQGKEQLLFMLTYGVFDRVEAQNKRAKKWLTHWQCRLTSCGFGVCQPCNGQYAYTTTSTSEADS